MAMDSHTDKTKTVLFYYTMHKCKVQLGRSHKHNPCYNNVT